MSVSVGGRHDDFAHTPHFTAYNAGALSCAPVPSRNGLQRNVLEPSREPSGTVERAALAVRRLLKWIASAKLLPGPDAEESVSEDRDPRTDATKRASGIPAT